MSSTVYFRESARLSFPTRCVGCGTDSPGERLTWTIFSTPSLSSGAKAFKAANVMIGLAMGGVGGAVGGAHLGDSLKKAKAVAVHTVPVCQPCLARFSSDQMTALSEASAKLFEGDGIKTPAFSLRMQKGCAVWTLENDAFARSMADLNHGTVFTSLDDCLAAPQASSAPGASPGDTGMVPPVVEATPHAAGEDSSILTVVEATRLARYESTYGRKLSPLEAAIVDAWHGNVKTFDSIHTHPDIPEKKLRNATETYAPQRGDALVIALQDSTVFGSAKEGALFTSTGVHWRSVNSSKVCQVEYSNLVPSSLTFESGFGKKHLVLGPELRIQMIGFGNEKPLVALCAFLVAAVTLSRLQHGRGDVDSGQQRSPAGDSLSTLPPNATGGESDTTPKSPRSGETTIAVPSEPAREPVAGEQTGADSRRLAFELKSQELVLASAIRSRDSDTLSRLLAQDYAFTSARGETWGRDRAIAEVSDPRFSVLHIAVDVDRVIVAGEAGIVTGQSDVEGHIGEVSLSGSFRFTHVWWRREGVWQIVAGHASLAQSGS